MPPLALRHIELAHATSSTQRQGQRKLPAPDPSQPGRTASCTLPSYPSKPLCNHASGHASTPKKSGTRRMNTLPCPSVTELTCTPCATLLWSVWRKASETIERARCLCETNHRAVFCAFRRSPKTSDCSVKARSHPAFYWSILRSRGEESHASHFPGPRFGFRLPPPRARCEGT